MKDILLMIFRQTGRLFLAGVVFFLVACDDREATNEKNATPTPTSEAVAEPGRVQDRTPVLEGKMSVLIPEGYRKMDRKMVAEAFGHVVVHLRPTEVWYQDSEDGRVMLGFSETNETFSVSQLAELVSMMEKQLASVSPRVTQITVDNKKIYRIETTSTVLIAGKGKADIVNILQPSVLDGKLLFTTFTFPASQRDKYINEAERVLSSLKW